MMRRMLIAIVGTALLVGLTVAPVGAAKGGPGPGGPPSQPTIQSVEGTYSGTSSATIFCTDGQLGVSPITGDAGVRASTLGRGSMHYVVNVGGSPGTWWFRAQDGKASLGGSAVLNIQPGQDPNPGKAVVTVTVTSGSGKFQGVHGMLTTESVISGGPPECGPGIFYSVPSVTIIQGPIYGQLIYG